MFRGDVQQEASGMASTADGTKSARRSPAIGPAAVVTLAFVAGLAATVRDIRAEATSPVACDDAAGEEVVGGRAAAVDEVDLVDGRRIKLVGVTPARAPLMRADPAWTAAAEGIMEAGRRRLEAAVEARTLRLVDFGADRHGRRRGHLFDTVDGQDMAAMLVSAGVVRVAAVGERSACIRALLVLEREARAARRGVWADPRLGVRRADDPTLDRALGTTVVVEGRVHSIGRSGTRTYLNFGDDFRRDFAVVLDDNLRNALSASGFDVEKARGRSVRVRGVLVLHEGLRIVPAAPEEVEWVQR